MMRRMLGAPVGGTTRGGQYGLESLALSLISPPNFIGDGGICFPSIVTVALGEPGVPVMYWALAEKAAVKMQAATAAQRPILVLIFMAVCLRVTDCLLGCDFTDAYGAPLLSERRRAFLLATSPCQRAR